MGNGNSDKKPKGAGKQFLGCVLFFLGLLNAMLSWKANIEQDWFNYALMISGAIVLGMGILESNG